MTVEPVDEEHLEALREVDALFPLSPPIAPPVGAMELVGKMRKLYREAKALPVNDKEQFVLTVDAKMFLALLGPISMVSLDTIKTYVEKLLNVEIRPESR